MQAMRMKGVPIAIGHPGVNAHVGIPTRGYQECFTQKDVCLGDRGKGKRRGESNATRGSNGPAAGLALHNQSMT